MAEFTQVTNVAQLKDLLKDGAAEFFIQLNHGGRSWKTLCLSSEVDKDGNQKIEILNENDETRQVLTEKNLFKTAFTNIGLAIERGAFFFAWQ